MFLSDRNVFPHFPSAQPQQLLVCCFDFTADIYIVPPSSRRTKLETVAQKDVTKTQNKSKCCSVSAGRVNQWQINIFINFIKVPCYIYCPLMAKNIKFSFKAPLWNNYEDLLIETEKNIHSIEYFFIYRWCGSLLCSPPWPTMFLQ